jgi:glycosyltransferase involved in cell wall biosynthesis
MRILQLCNKMPYPAMDGYALAVINLAKAFSVAGNEVRLLCMNTTRHYVDEKKIPAALNEKLELRAVKVDNRISAGDAFVKLLQNRSYNVSRFISGDFDEALQKTLKEFAPDIVQLEGLYLTPYIDTIRKYSKAKIALRAHNVEHLIWYRNSEQEKSFAKKVYLKVLAKQLLKYEKNVLGRVDLLVPVSGIDADGFKGLENKKPVHICPVSYDDLSKNGTTSCEPDSVFFIGSLDWIPNAEGLQWFLDNVWAKVHREFPSLKFYIAGRNIPSSVTSDKKKNITVVGEVENGRAWMQGKRIMVVPLFAGSGMRVKIVEGLSAGKVIISTGIGAEGIPVENKKEILVANTAEEFVNAFSLCRDESKMREMEERAKTFAEQHYSATATARELLTFYQTHL